MAGASVRKEQTTSDSAFLHAHGIDVGAETLSVLIRRVVETFPRGLRGAPREELSPEEVSMLERGGGDLEPRDLGEQDPVARAAAEMVALVESSLTTSEAAARLGVDPSRIRQRLAERSLYGFEWEGRWLLPLFQFREDRFVRGLDRLFPVLDPELSPIEVQSWLTTPDPDLHAAKLGRDLTPLEWLELGYPVRRLVHIARNL